MLRLNVDCLVLIFDELQDKKSLHSCLLVNREWCRLVVPILWRNYSWCNVEEFNFFNTILSWLSSSSKQLLSDNDIKLPPTTLLKPPLFNYISFCRFPETEIINRMIEMVLGNQNVSVKKNILEREIYKLFISQCKNVKEFVWRTTQPLSLFPGATTCFSQLYRLTIDLDYINSNSLNEMAKICKDLNILSINNCSQDFPGLISLIDAQRNLNFVTICNNSNSNINNKKENCEELSKALTRKGNTINYLHLDSVNTIIPPSFLTSLVNLTWILVYNDEQYEDTEKIKEFQRYLAISEYPDLRSLNITGLLCFKELSTLVEKTRGNISRIYIYTINLANRAATNTGMLIKSIAKNCPKIKFLRTYLEPEDFIHVKSLLLNCRNLEDISFDNINFFVNESDDNVGDELLNILAKFSPKSLTHITISGSWKYSIDTFERFFASYRGKFILHFYIEYHYDKYYITEDHRKIIRRYVDEGVIRYQDHI
jgi:hypothetical protein